MIAVSEAGVRYARNGDVHLAYRVLGNGDIPLVVVPGWISNVDLWATLRTRGRQLSPRSWSRPSW